VKRVAGALLLALFALGFWARLDEPFGVDQGLFACFTRLLPRGALPYRDLFDSKPPLFLYWWALPSALPLELHRAVWLVESVWMLGTAWAAHRLARALWHGWAALFAAALVVLGLWAPGFGAFWSRAQAEALLALPMLLSARLLLGGRARDLLLSGVLVGVCGLFKIPSMAIAAAWATMLLWSRARPRRIASFASGFALPWALAVAFFSSRGALRRFYEGVFQYHRYNAELIAPPWDRVLSGFAAELLSSAALLVAAASVGGFALLRRGDRAGRWLVSWFAFSAAAVVLQRQLAGYHFLLVVPGLALLGGYGLAVTVRAARRRRPWALAVAAGLALLVAREAASFRAAYAPGLELALGRIDRPTYLRRLQTGAFSMVLEEEAARFVAARSSPGQGILVWGLSPGIYALADRHPVTRFPFHKLLYTDAPLSRMIPGLPERRRELLERLARDPPSWVLVGRGDQNPFEPLDSASSLRRFPELAERLEHDFVLDTALGRFLCYRRKG
jgi:hypothetical protein